MSVDLNPHAQLGFPRPLTQLVKRTLQVSNPNNQPIAFKVKTTAPKQYCVRPNSGRIEPGEKVDVQVLLQPMKEEPPISAKCRDKFLVQSTIITPELETASLTDIWPQIEKTNKAAIHEQKIRCAFLPATAVPVAEEDEGAGSALASDEKYTTVRGTPKSNADESFSTLNTTPAANKLKSFAPSVSPAVAGAGTRAVNGLTTEKSPEELSKSELQAEVTRLRRELESKRSNAALGTKVQQSSTADGVPVHIVAAIAFAVFAITYILF